jgi:hypothetical protein
LLRLLLRALPQAAEWPTLLLRLLLGLRVRVHPKVQPKVSEKTGLLRLVSGLRWLSRASE